MCRPRACPPSAIPASPRAGAAPISTPVRWRKWSAAGASACARKPDAEPFGLLERIHHAGAPPEAETVMALRKLGALFTASIALFLSSCTMAAFNILVPRSGYSVHSDIAYGGDPQQ